MNQIFALLMGFAIVSCGNPSESKKSRQQDPDGREFLLSAGVANSTYFEKCINDENKEFSQQSSILFLQTTFEKRWSSFTGADCQGSQRRTTYVYPGVDVRDAADSELGGWKRITFQSGIYTATVHTEALAKTFSKRANFDYRDWVANKPKVINGRRYNQESETKWDKGVNLENHVLIVGSIVQIAQYEDGVPTSENPMIYEKK